jgi:hypothetical protein
MFHCSNIEFLIKKRDISRIVHASEVFRFIWILPSCKYCMQANLITPCYRKKVIRIAIKRFFRLLNFFHLMMDTRGKILLGKHDSLVSVSEQWVPESRRV